MSQDKSKPKDDQSSFKTNFHALWDTVREVTHERKGLGRRKALDAVLDAPKSIQREWQNMVQPEF